MVSRATNYHSWSRDPEIRRIERFWWGMLIICAIGGAVNIMHV